MHAAVELMTAIALIVAPFALGLSLDATIAAAGIGFMLLGLALSATDTDGRGTLPISAHATYDAAIALVLLAMAVIFGLAGEPLALAVLLVAGVAQLVLNGFTRYSPSHA